MKSSDKGVCYIETKNLDGETNLKIKKSPRSLNYLNALNDARLFKEKIFVKYEKPNPYLYKFNGNFT